MAEENYHALVGEALDPLINGLSPFIERVFSTVLPPGLTWPSVLRQKDAVAGRRGGVYAPHDLSLMLRAITESLGGLGYPFDGHLTRQAQNYAKELREVRNQWAHNATFTAQSAHRAIDSAELLLASIGAHAQAEQLGGMKRRVLPAHGFGDPGEPGADRGASATAGEASPSRTTGAEQVPSAPTDAAARISISAVCDLSYAMAHCRVPVVDEIVLGPLDQEARGASLEVEVVSADGSLGGPKVLLVDLAEGRRSTLRSVDLVLDPARMLAIDEQRPGRITATLRDSSGLLLAERAVDVTIMAPQQWKASPVQLGLEMLTAHVQPNAACIPALLVEASDLLAVTTGRSALDGYQREDPERVDAIVAAIYDAMRARDIRYAEPPASWGLSGQRVRTPADVLVGRLGTCLDTTLTLAAALEHAGINSTLWLLKGHIFLGYWRADRALPAVASSDPADVVNLVDLGHIGLVETTLMTGGEQSAPFEEARRQPRARHLSNGLSEILGVTDVRRARESEIFPLPSRAEGANGQVEVRVYQRAAGPVTSPPALGDGGVVTIYRPVAVSDQALGRRRDNVPSRVSRWKNALLDLSLRNRLINYTERSGHRLDVPGEALGRLEDALHAQTSIALLPSDQVPQIAVARGVKFGRDLPEPDREVLLDQGKSAYIDITGAAYTSTLRRLAYKAKTIVEETGANNLYLAFGMLHWRFNDRGLRSPLVLVPVQLSTTARGATYRLTIDEAASSTPNFCLLEKLRVAFDLDIQGLGPPAEDASGIDLHATFAAVRRAVVKAQLPFHVEETVELSVLQFAKFPLWKDLDENWETLRQNPLVDHLIATPTEAFSDPAGGAVDVDLDNLGAGLPVPADSSQLEAVARAVAGHTFVLEGPPGTGKSQTITNILARALVEQRRVLFVAEKRAALNVVKERLDAVGLGALALDLHDKAARPAFVRAQIKAALDLQAQADEELLRTSAETAESSRRSLARYAERLHDKNGAGHSLYSARGRALAASPEIAPLELPHSFVAHRSPEEIERTRRVLLTLPETADFARPRPDHPWSFIDGRPFVQLDTAVIHSAAVELQAALEAALEAGLDLATLGRAGSPQRLADWARLAAVPRHPVSALVALRTSEASAQLSRIDRQLQAITAQPPGWVSLVRPSVMDRDVPAIHVQALAADQSGFFGRKKRRRAVLARFADALLVPPASVDLRTLSSLTQEMVTTQAMVAELRDRVAELPLTLVESGWNPIAPGAADDLRRALSWAGWAAGMLTEQGDAFVVDLRAHYASTPAGAGSEVLARLTAAWERLSNVALCSPAAMSEWAPGSDFLTHWWATRAARNVGSTATLERWLALLQHVEPLRDAGLASARSAVLSGRVQAQDATLAFDHGVALASIDERREAKALEAFDAAAHNQTIQRFSMATQAYRSELPHALPAEVVRQRRFDSSAEGGQIGGLRRQLDRQRGGMRVRALLDTYGELITGILPCTLASPESVARLFPARAGLFDVIVFDEASQIRVADAIGAMGRATSVVVVGDSKQMPPSSFAEAVGGIDEIDGLVADTVADEESILTECVQARVPSTWLSWHYRSQDESLIAFSNDHYYGNRLASFPAPHGDGPSVGVHGHGVWLVRVDGTFERTGRGSALRTNRVEATAIVDDVKRRFAASTEVVPSVGVITFNAQQRDLIDNLLRDCGDDRIVKALDEPDGLFVKNLENVQGDERDCILFSVAFSANEKGVVPLNFGPLSRPGGERRLNVAVTRARRQVVLYASFDPQDLRAEETTQVGTKHLKAYLEMASRGTGAVSDDGRRRAIPDRHRDDVAEALRGAGWVVQTDVGLSDFRIDLALADPSSPHRPLVAVLLDGPSWRERRTVADRDGLPVEVLKNLMRWPGVERVWLPEWLTDRAGTLARLGSAMEAAKRDAASDPAAEVPGPQSRQTGAVGSPLRSAADPDLQQPARRPTLEPAPLRSMQAGDRLMSHAAVVDYAEWEPGAFGPLSVLDGLPMPWAVARVQAAVRAAIAAEGPIHHDRLTKLVAGAFGLRRVSADRQQAISLAVPPVYQRRAGEPFYWPTSIDPDAWRGVRRTPPGVSRSLDSVPLVEIANAMCVVAESAGGLDDEEIKREALAVFGGRRLTPAIEARLNEAVQLALDSARIARSSAGVLVVQPA